MDDCEQMADQYGARECDPNALEDCEPDEDGEYDETDAQRRLAERIGQALYDRKELLSVLEMALTDIRNVVGERNAYGMLLSDPDHPWHRTATSIEKTINEAKGVQS